MGWGIEALDESILSLAARMASRIARARFGGPGPAKTRSSTSLTTAPPVWHAERRQERLRVLLDGIDGHNVGVLQSSQHFRLLAAVYGHLHGHLAVSQHRLASQVDMGKGPRPSSSIN